jgi:imidazolonepropionase-like amidohydrolase
MRTTHLHGCLAASLLAALPHGATQGGEKDEAPAGRGYVAIQAGTIHVVEDGRVVEDGTILIKDGRIQAVGADVAIPLDARVVDYGPDAVVIPGVVAADSSFGSGSPSERTADPAIRAIDNFDFYAENASALEAGVTTVYLNPTDARLIGGEGAVVKLAGDDFEHRTLAAPATVDCAIHAPARNTPGYWDPPVPATVDVGIGYAKEQLPKTAMGAIVAFHELLDAAQGKRPTGEYGPHAVQALADLLGGGTPWRITAQTEDEIRAVLAFAGARDVQVVLEGARDAGYLADEIAAAGVPVVYSLPWSPSGRGIDRGKDEDDRWPRYDVPAKLVAAGVRVAITAPSVGDIFFAAAVASQGKLDPAAALRAITLTPAEIYGVADRVGSLSPGKDADLVVLNAPPISLGASVRATWVDGELAWSFETTGARAKAAKEGDLYRETVAIQVDELHLGDGRVLSPGQVIIRNGKITSVSEGHATPAGARIVRGAAAMPGIVDALGHLGLEGSSKVPGADTELKSLVAPGDATDRRVAKAGVTTVALAPRGTNGGGTPVMAYKPAAREFDRQIVADPAAIRLQWTDGNDRRNSGKDVRDLLEKAKEYRKEWAEYEEAIASWTPPAPEQKEEAEEEAKSSDEGEKTKDVGDKDDEDDKKSKKKKKKKDEEEVEPDPITGVWTAAVARPPLADAARLRMQVQMTVEDGGGPITGNLRCAALTEGLVDVEGYYDAEARSVSLKGLGSQGWITLAAEYAEGKLTGAFTLGPETIDVEIERESREFVVASRSERRRVEKPDEPKGKPKEPKLDAKLEPLRRAMDGKTAVIVNVDRDDEILGCVDAFARYGIEPVLYGAGGIERVATRVAGRIQGVIGAGAAVSLQEAGIPFAFHSQAEEGAADLPLLAMYAVANGMSPSAALRALTADAADMLSIGEHVGRIAAGRAGDVVLLDGPPLAPGTSVLRVWVNGIEVE